MQASSSNSSSGGGGISQCPVPAAPQRGCVGRHLANINKMRVSGSDSNALLFLFDEMRYINPHTYLLTYLCLVYLPQASEGGLAGVRLARSTSRRFILLWLDE